MTETLHTSKHAEEIKVDGKKAADQLVDFDFVFKMKAIDLCRKQFFQALEERLNVIRVQAPIFIPTGTGI